MDAETAYLFGDTELAAQRLCLLAAVFEPSTRAFLQEVVYRPPCRVVDLGCGPGYSTELLARTLSPHETFGLDRSPRFVASARQCATRAIQFHVHDVTSLPLPVLPSDVMYCRFLLSHLRNPQQVIKGWMGQLQDGGLLLVEETSEIHVSNPTFRRYLDIVDRFLRAQGSELYAGRLVEAIDAGVGSIKRASRLARVRPSNRDTARLFLWNLQGWREQPFVKANYSCAEIDRLEAELREMTCRTSAEFETEFVIRQVAFERE